MQNGKKLLKLYVLIFNKNRLNMTLRWAMILPHPTYLLCPLLIPVH